MKFGLPFLIPSGHNLFDRRQTRLRTQPGNRGGGNVVGKLHCQPIIGPATDCGTKCRYKTVPSSSRVDGSYPIFSGAEDEAVFITERGPFISQSDKRMLRSHLQ